MQYFYGFFNKRKVYHVDQTLDVIEKNRGHFRIQRSKVSQKQVPDLSEQKLCSPVLWLRLRLQDCDCMITIAITTTRTRTRPVLKIKTRPVPECAQINFLQFVVT